MQNELAHSYAGHLGLQTLLKRLHQLCSLQPDVLVTETPPIRQLAAIWLTQLRPNGWRGPGLCAALEEVYYRHTQPAAVATLRRDFRQTLTYYHLQQQYPHWPRACLRTTSHLERFNKNLRRRCRAARAFHSDQGSLAMIAQVARCWNTANSYPKTQIFHL